MRTRINSGGNRSKLSRGGNSGINAGSLRSGIGSMNRSMLYGAPSVNGNGIIDFRILEDDDFRITEDGNFRILE